MRVSNKQRVETNLDAVAFDAAATGERPRLAWCGTATPSPTISTSSQIFLMHL